jgi:HEAT repeat protein
MPTTLEQIKAQLSAIEPNDGTYLGIGPLEIPFLEQLLQDEEVWMASRAVFALSRIPDARAITVLSQAAVDPRQGVRVALAASVSNLKPEDANDLLLQLLTDTEMGVRKFAVLSVSEAHNAAVSDKLKEIEFRDPAPAIREIAKDRLQAIN